MGLSQKCYGRIYELEEYDGDDLLDVLDGIPLADEVTVDDLLGMGWYHRVKWLICLIARTIRTVF